MWCSGPHLAVPNVLVVMTKCHQNVLQLRDLERKRGVATAVGRGVVISVTHTRSIEFEVSVVRESAMQVYLDLLLIHTL